MLARGTDLQGSLPASKAPVNLAVARANWAVACRKLCCTANTGGCAPRSEVLIQAPISSTNGSSSSRRRRMQRSRSSRTTDSGAQQQQQQHFVLQQPIMLTSSTEAAANTHARTVVNGNSTTSSRRKRSSSSSSSTTDSSTHHHQQQHTDLTIVPDTAGDAILPTTANGNGRTAADLSLSLSTPAAAAAAAVQTLSPITANGISSTASDPLASLPTQATRASTAAAAAAETLSPTTTNGNSSTAADPLVSLPTPTPAAAAAAPGPLNEFTQPVSIMVVELIAPSYAVARMVRIINDDKSLTATRVPAFAAVERNPWTHKFRSLRSPDVIGVAEDCYKNINGSICKPAIQAQLMNQVQQQLEQSVEGYSSGQRCIDGVLVFAAPPSTAYSMPVWHLDSHKLLDDSENNSRVTDFNNRLSAADRIVVSVLDTYQGIEALCATTLHPVTKAPVPCSMILQNDWVNDDLQFGASSSSSLFDPSSNGHNSSSSNTDLNSQFTTTSSSSGGSTDFDPNSNGQSTNYNPKLQHHLPVILGLRNRLFLEPYLSGPVTHGPFQVLKHYWCTDGHLARRVQPSVIITDVPGMSGNACWCGKCDKHPSNLEPKDLKLHKERDSRYMVPRTLTSSSSSSSSSSKEPPKAGQQPPRTVWPESFVMTAIMNFKMHVARQLLAAAAEDADAAHVVAAAAAGAAASRAAATEELAKSHSRSRDISSKKIANLSTRPAVEKDISEIVIRDGQTVSVEHRRRDLMARSIERWLWPLADSYKVKIRKKARKLQLVEDLLQYEQQEALIA